jgi:guanosine-3',5'-bis(diphosphate) 3'-pyrophosphohydrolase
MPPTRNASTFIAANPFANGGIFEGEVMLFVYDTDHLSNLMDKLKKVPGVLTVIRIDAE